jgi:predicted ABC-type transport system involved in lysophospholipase L1 biosynthesis ATPase subunit
MRELRLGVTALAANMKPNHPHAKGDMKQDLSEIGLGMRWKNFPRLLLGGAKQQKEA